MARVQRGWGVKFEREERSLGSGIHPRGQSISAKNRNSTAFPVLANCSWDRNTDQQLSTLSVSGTDCLLQCDLDIYMNGLWRIYHLPLNLKDVFRRKSLRNSLEHPHFLSGKFRHDASEGRLQVLTDSF